MLSEEHEPNPSGFSKIAEMLEQLGIQEEIAQPSYWLGHEMQLPSVYSTKVSSNSYFGREARFDDDSQTNSAYFSEKYSIRFHCQ